MDFHAAYHVAKHILSGHDKAVSTLLAQRQENITKLIQSRCLAYAEAINEVLDTGYIGHSYPVTPIWTPDVDRQLVRHILANKLTLGFNLASFATDNVVFKHWTPSLYIIEKRLATLSNYLQLHVFHDALDNSAADIGFATLAKFHE